VKQMGAAGDGVLLHASWMRTKCINSRELSFRACVFLPQLRRGVMMAM